MASDIDSLDKGDLPEMLETKSPGPTWHPQPAIMESEWPYLGRYFVSRCMDADVKDLLDKDSKFLLDEPNPFHCIDITPERAVHSIHTYSPTGSPEPSPNSSRLIFVAPSRRVSDRSTYVNYRISRREWLGLLQQCHVPPPVLHLLHDNNGNSFQHTSYCGDNPFTTSPCDAFDGSLPCAYHICIKHCVWHKDHFLYARYDFHTRSILILTDSSQLKILRQFDFGGADLFDIILSLMSIWARDVEEMRWQINYRTRSYESQTGVSALALDGKMIVPRERMRFRTDIAATQDTLRVVARASNHLGELWAFTRAALPRFGELCAEHDVALPKTYIQQMSDALDMQITQSHTQGKQMADLKARLTSQGDIVNAILSNYSNELTIGMAKDSREDSVLMRRIALVTMIFLPATFLATFFSMVFFDVEGTTLAVSKWVWLYFVCTVPVTFGLAWQYGLADKMIGLLKFRGRG